ncbi:MAG: FUSC family protein, partial [Clostridia bacterium]|nr:FUSC family protein [Clostridia bacterium]
FKDIISDFSLSESRSRWQIKIALCVSGAVFVATLLNFPKPVWAGIAAMSVTVPVGNIKERVEGRIRGNMIADIMFIFVSIAVPVEFMQYASMAGGFGAGFCGKYEGQTAWNSLSAMTVAASVIGVYSTIVYRIINNVLGALFAFALGTVIERVLSGLYDLFVKAKQRRTLRR